MGTSQRCQRKTRDHERITIHGQTARDEFRSLIFSRHLFNPRGPESGLRQGQYRLRGEIEGLRAPAENL
jgi:hypothetical protein